MHFQMWLKEAAASQVPRANNKCPIITQVPRANNKCPIIMEFENGSLQEFGGIEWPTDQPRKD